MVYFYWKWNCIFVLGRMSATTLNSIRPHSLSVFLILNREKLILTKVYCQPMCHKFHKQYTISREEEKVLTEMWFSMVKISWNFRKKMCFPILLIKAEFLKFPEIRTFPEKIISLILTLNCIRGGTMVPNIWFFGSRILTLHYFRLIIFVIA